MIAMHPRIYIAIGASGGKGLEDIAALLAALDDPLAAIVMVVLHRPTDKVSHLCEILGRTSPMKVVVAGEGEDLRPGTCYIGEPAAHLTLGVLGSASMIDDPHNSYRNRTVDALFGSVAEHAGRQAVGIVLSGSLDDGSRGLAAIHAVGGATMVLKSARAPWRGMPENAATYDGPLTATGTPEELAREINRIARRDSPRPAARC